jgi:hypothetical protein
MTLLKKLSSILLVLFVVVEYGQASFLKESNRRTGESVEEDRQNAWNLDKAKMAISNTIAHYLRTGEWKAVGCEDTSTSFSYVWCHLVGAQNVTGAIVLHPAMSGLTKTQEKQLLEMADKIDQHINDECTCDHNSFWTLATYDWSDSEEFGSDFIKTSLVTKVYSSERDGENYDPCSPGPQDEVYVCGQGVWEDKK